MVRDVDKLLQLSDLRLKQQDTDYLARHKLDALFAELLKSLITQQPRDPIQFIIDSVEHGTELAEQDSTTGLPQYRKHKLLDVFRVIDKEQTGRISFRQLQIYTNKYGGEALSTADLQSIFQDFKPTGDNLITLPEFMAFFSKVSRTITNAAFDKMVAELLQ